MNIDVTSLLWAALLMGSQIVVIYVLAKILSKPDGCNFFLADKIGFLFSRQLWMRLIVFI